MKTLVYTKTNWQNKSESLATPLGKTNLNHMEDGIYQIAENLNVAYSELSSEKFDETNAGKVIVGMPTWDADTGILTFRFYDGTEFSVDFNIEKIPVSFSMDSAGVITMTTSDGTQWTANIGDVIPDYVFEDSDRIAFTKTKNADGSYFIKADIKKNSITGEYLEPDYLANVKAQASNAESSAKSASDSADAAAYDVKLVQSYAIGGSGIREEEDTDNAKYYKEQAAESASAALEALENMQDAQVTGVKGDKETDYRRGNVNITPSNIGAVATSAIANNLLTNVAGYVLDARQGRIINDKIGSIQIVSVSDVNIGGAVNAGSTATLSVAYTLPSESLSIFIIPLAPVSGVNVIPAGVPEYNNGTISMLVNNIGTSNYLPAIYAVKVIAYKEA